MCYHNSLSISIQMLGKRYNRKIDLIEIVEDIISENYHVNAFNYPTYPIITADEEIQAFNWGLIPFWVKTEKDAKEIRSRTLNARSENLFDRPSYREPVKRSRCLIPATGFFEWRHEGKQKLPYYIHLTDEPVFSMAGLYDRWHDPETNSTIFTFTQVTTDANPLMEWVYNSKERMPALLSRKDEETWLDPTLTRKDIESLLQPYDESRMAAYPIDRNFLKMNPKEKRIIEKVDHSKGSEETKGLF